MTLPVKKTITVEISYYSCGVDDRRHFHKTKKSAKQCMDRRVSRHSNPSLISECHAIYSQDNTGVLDTPIAEITGLMSRRSYTCLLNYGLHSKTFGDFLCIPEKDLLKNYRNFGRKTVDEICNLIEGYKVAHK